MVQLLKKVVLKLLNKLMILTKLKLEEIKIIDNNYFEVYKDEDDISEFIRVLVNNKIDIYEVIKESLTLEEAFINIAGGKNV